MILEKFLFFFSMVHFCSPAELPPFIKPCPKSQPEVFEQCALGQSQRVVSELKDGYPPFDIQPLDPLHLEHINLPLSNDFIIKMDKAIVEGLTTSTFNRISPEFKDDELKSLTISLVIPKLNIKSFYSIEGFFFIATVKGEGESEIDITDLTVDLKMDFGIDVRNDEKYYQLPRDFHIDIDFATIKTYFENMVPDKDMNDIVNNFVNKNSKIVFLVLKPGIVKTVRDILHSIMLKLIMNVPAKNFFVH